MIKLLRFLGCVDYIREDGELGSGWKTTVNRKGGGQIYWVYMGESFTVSNN